MKTITVPTYEQVSPANQAIFDNLKKGLGFVPNLHEVRASPPRMKAQGAWCNIPVGTQGARGRKTIEGPTPRLT